MAPLNPSCTPMSSLQCKGIARKLNLRPMLVPADLYKPRDRRFLQLASVLHAASSAQPALPHKSSNRFEIGLHAVLQLRLSCYQALSSFGWRAGSQPPMLSRHANNLQHHASQAVAALPPLVRSAEFAEVAG